MTPRSKELLSYLIGLGPVGEPVHADPRLLAEDLGLHKRPHRVQLLSRLVRCGAVKRLGGDIFIVLKRVPPEKDWEYVLKKNKKPKEWDYFDPEYMSENKMEQIRRGQEGWERKRREFEEAMASIPRDTRDLTARLMGDPLPTRSALDRKRMQENV